MKRNIGNLEIKKMFEELEKKKNKFFNRHYTRYVVDYKIEEDKIKVISNIGEYRIVKNTKSNLSKINRAIVKNKVNIAQKIDEYENHSQERLMVLLLNICLVCGSGILVPFAFFTGIYAFFLLSIAAFSLCVITTLSSGVDYYILIKEIQNLKKITGYKKENEFKLSVINVKSLKSRN